MPGPQPDSQPDSAAAAARAARASLGWLAAADPADLTTIEQADCLRALEQAESMLTAARARILAAFRARDGYHDDGHRSARTWLAWQTRVTPGAAAGAVAWTRRLADHPALTEALASGELSASWARQLTAWTDQLPVAARPAADQILVTAARSGVDLAGLGELAAEIRARTATPDSDAGDFIDRRLHLDRTYDGAGRLTGDLTPACAAALDAVLEALGGRAGPEDLRTLGQRHHDALEEACRRLTASDCLPARAGQPTRILLHMTLSQLRRQAGASTPATPPGPATTSGGPHIPAGGPDWIPCPGPAAPPGADCDATIVPVVTARPDLRLLARLAEELVNRPASSAPHHQRTGHVRHPAPGQPARQDQPAGPEPAERRQDTGREQRAMEQLLTARAADLLSGPRGLASWLRTTHLTGPAASISLPLDIGTATDTIAAHLRRAVITRDQHCRFPGCTQPPAASQIHHLVPRAHDGPTALTNLILLCPFHHLTAIHRWGWTLTLSPDGTTTATSPDQTRTLYSHGPPATAA
ncbi:MAG TPA: DUF222 domain-containing protein [Streptosporangiaceae bacterium]|jgi:hypothetical protein